MFELPETIETPDFKITAGNRDFYSRLWRLQYLVDKVRFFERLTSPVFIRNVSVEWDYFKWHFPNETFFLQNRPPELPIISNFCRGVIQIRDMTGNQVATHQADMRHGIQIAPYADEVLNRFEKTGRAWIHDVRNGAVIEDEFEDFMLLKR